MACNLDNQYIDIVDRLRGFQPINTNFNLSATLIELKKVYEIQIERFGHQLKGSDPLYDDYHLIESVELQIIPSHSCIYIVTFANNISLMVKDLDYKAIDNLMKHVSNFPVDKNSDIFGISSLFIFVASRLICVIDLTPFDLANLMVLFANDNLIDFTDIEKSYLT